MVLRRNHDHAIVISDRHGAYGYLHSSQLARNDKSAARTTGRLLSIMIPRCLLISALLIGAACSSSTTSELPLFTTPSLAPTTTLTPTTAATSTSDTSTTAAATTPIPTTTTVPLVVTGGVVRVANATEVEEAAQKLSNEFASLGFTIDEPTNAAGKDELLMLSKIYVIAGSEGVAESVSYLMGGIEILRMPTPAWITGGTAGLGATTVLVMLGSDLAGSPLLTMRFEPGRQGPD